MLSEKNAKSYALLANQPCKCKFGYTRRINPLHNKYKRRYTCAFCRAPGWRTVTCCDIMLDCPIGSILCVCHMTVMTTATYIGK